MPELDSRPDQYIDFLTGRTVSQVHRDIEKILFCCGLSQYDVVQIAQVTRAIHANDFLRVAHNPEERLADVVFSTFCYDFSREHIVHFRRLFAGRRSDREYRNLVSVRPGYRDGIARMILLDFITRQDDRHLSNIAIKVSPEGESF